MCVAHVHSCALLAADAAGGVPSFLTLLGIALYGGLAWLAVRLAVRWAEAALSPPADVPPVNAAGEARAGRDCR